MYGMIASGLIDIVLEDTLKAHDYMALIPVIEGAGGVITNWEGNKLNFDESNVYVLASASKDLHNLALKKLN